MNHHYYGGDTVASYSNFGARHVPYANEATAVNTATADHDDDEDENDFKAALVADSEFLLRAALSYDWDTCTGFCGFLQQLLTKNYPPDTWRRQHSNYRRIIAAKEQLLAQDQWGNTALHAACYNAAPLRVVQGLLQAAAAYKTPIDMCRILSRDQSTPLLVACATGASTEVIAALLHPPTRSTTSILPSVGTANTTNMAAIVEVADQQGSTPFSELAIHYELRRKSPMHTHTSLPLDQVQHLFLANANEEDPLLESFQAKLQLLLQAAWDHEFTTTHDATTTIHNTNHDITTNDMISLVHGMAHAAQSCPPVITRLVLRCFPNMISVMDSKVGLPLHLAVRRRNMSMSSSSCQCARQRHAYCIQQLLQAYPDAARMVAPRGKGRLPFHQAIASGWWWHATTTTTSSITAADRNNKGPIQWLYQAAPESLSQIDPVTGLYPVLLAAATYTSTATAKTTISPFNKQQSSEPHSNEFQILQLDTIYNLLLLHPQIVEESI